MKKLLEIYKDAFETSFGLFKTEGFKFFASILGLIFLTVFILVFAAFVTCNFFIFILILLGEIFVTLPIYVKLCRNLDEY